MCSSGKWVTAAINVAGSGNLVAGNIKKGVNIFNVVGTYDYDTDHPMRQYTECKPYVTAVSEQDSTWSAKYSDSYIPASSSTWAYSIYIVLNPGRFWAYHKDPGSFAVISIAIEIPRSGTKVGFRQTIGGTEWGTVDYNTAATGGSSKHKVYSQGADSYWFHAALTNTRINHVNGWSTNNANADFSKGYSYIFSPGTIVKGIHTWGDNVMPFCETPLYTYTLPSKLQFQHIWCWFNIHCDFYNGGVYWFYGN